RARRTRGARRRQGHRRQRRQQAGARGARTAQLAGPKLRNQEPTRNRDKNMAELTISSDEIRSAIENYVSNFSTETSREEVGTVVETGDGIAQVEGLPSAMTNELLEFPGGILGVALNLSEREIGTVILGDYEHIEEGQEVKRTGRVLSVPVGDKFLGRVIDPLGAPIDGLGDI